MFHWYKHGLVVNEALKIATLNNELEAKPAEERDGVQERTVINLANDLILRIEGQNDVNDDFDPNLR